MVVIGVDPGTVITGYGVIRVEEGKCTVLDYGAVKPPRGMELPDKYWTIFSALDTLAKRFNPDVFVIETQFVQKNVQTALKLGMARGSAIIAAKKAGAEVVEYSPTTVKKAITGTGHADKEKLAIIVQSRLSLKEKPTPEDASDALALALAYIQRGNSCLCS